MSEVSIAASGLPDAIALFPLHTVLFPGGSLTLRIFEPRYLDMVRDCTRTDRGFGVCLLVDGSEVADPRAPVATVSCTAFGTEARIVDFASASDGVLEITVRGERRFRVERTRLRDNGQMLADVGWLAEPPYEPLRAEHGLLSTLLFRLIERFGGPHRNVAQRCFDDPAWVCWRLAEMLPLPMTERQCLLQENDPHARLDRLIAQLPDIEGD